ncbi:hypothetical protein AB1N83_012370 [Pleurotus pulmonarius]
MRTELEPRMRAENVAQKARHAKVYSTFFNPRKQSPPRPDGCADVVQRLNAADVVSSSGDHIASSVWILGSGNFLPPVYFGAEERDGDALQMRRVEESFDSLSVQDEMMGMFGPPALSVSPLPTVHSLRNHHLHRVLPSQTLSDPSSRLTS